MDPELRGLLDTLTELAKVEANFREHSEKFLEVREDILRAVHESCRVVSRRVQIHIANTVPVMVGGEDFEQQLARATPSPQGKRDTAVSVSHHSIQGEANESVDQPIAQEKKSISTEDHGDQGEANEFIDQRTAQEQNPISTEDHGDQGEANEFVHQHIPISTNDNGIQGETNEFVHQHIPISTNDNGIQGEANEFVHQHIPISTEDHGIQEKANESVEQHNPISTEDHGIQGEANESVDQPIAQEKKSISTGDHGNQGEAGNLNVPERWRPGLSPVTKVWKTIRPSVILRTQLAQSARQIPNPSQATPTETDLHIQPPRPAGQIRRKPQKGKWRREGGIVGKDDVA